MSMWRVKFDTGNILAPYGVGGTIFLYILYHHVVFCDKLAKLVMQDIKVVL
jgi:hypothetical protein